MGFQLCCAIPGAPLEDGLWAHLRPGSTKISLCLHRNINIMPRSEPTKNACHLGNSRALVRRPSQHILKTNLSRQSKAPLLTTIIRFKMKPRLETQQLSCTSVAATVHEVHVHAHVWHYINSSFNITLIESASFQKQVFPDTRKSMSRGTLHRFKMS